MNKESEGECLGLCVFFMFSSFLVVFLVFFHILNERGPTLIPTLT